MNEYRHGGDIYDKDITLDFSVNINPLGLPDHVKKVLVNQLYKFSCYPDTECRELINAIGVKEGINCDFVICGNGASDLIFRLCYGLKPKKAMVLAPTFSEYEKALKSIDCDIIYHRLNQSDHFTLTDTILKFLDKSVDILFLCNPNNPVGNLIPKELIPSILDQCEKNEIFLVMDECFLDFVELGSQNSLKKYVSNNKHIFILKAFTKLYAMAGLRLGYGITSNLELLEIMKNSGCSWSVSVPAQIAGVQALKEKEYLEHTKKLIDKERSYLSDSLRNLGFEVYEPQANYIFFYSKFELYKCLLEKGILIRHCSNYHQLTEGFYRIGIKSHEENQFLIRSITECIGGK